MFQIHAVADLDTRGSKAAEFGLGLDQRRCTFNSLVRLNLCLNLEY